VVELSDKEEREEQPYSYMVKRLVPVTMLPKDWLGILELF
jgi:hypothetical protein